MSSLMKVRRQKKSDKPEVYANPLLNSHALEAISRVVRAFVGLPGGQREIKMVNGFWYPRLGRLKSHWMKRRDVLGNEILYPDGRMHYRNCIYVGKGWLLMNVPELTHYKGAK